MSAIVNVFFPKSQKPLNDFENEIIRVQEGVASVGIVIRALNSSGGSNPGAIDAAKGILTSQTKKVESVMVGVQEELSKINQKKCGKVAVDSNRFYTVLLSGGDTILVVAGLVLAATGDTKTKVAGGVLTALGQSFSKMNDIISHKREEELKRKGTLEEFYSSAVGMNTSIKSLLSCLEYLIKDETSLPGYSTFDCAGGRPESLCLTEITKKATNAHFLNEVFTQYQENVGDKLGKTSFLGVVPESLLVSER